MESFERINSIRETNGNFDSCNLCERLVPSRYTSCRITSILRKLSNLSVRKFRICLLMYTGSMLTNRSASLIKAGLGAVGHASHLLHRHVSLLLHLGRRGGLEDGRGLHQVLDVLAEHLVLGAQLQVLLLDAVHALRQIWNGRPRDVSDQVSREVTSGRAGHPPVSTDCVRHTRTVVHGICLANLMITSGLAPNHRQSQTLKYNITILFQVTSKCHELNGIVVNYNNPLR